MGSKKYHLIDKSIVTEGIAFDFNLFVLSKLNNKAECFKESGCEVESSEAIIAEALNALYVEDSERKNYDMFYKTYLCKPTKDANTILKETTKELYLSASKALDNLFSNPETLGHYKKSKNIVVNLVDIILDNNYTVKSLTSIISQDYYTHTHSINVAIYSVSLGLYLGLKKETLVKLGESALLHDLGKSKISSAIINKNGKLTSKEFKQMKNHPLIGYKIAIQLGIRNKAILEGIRDHHEKMDGSGYPSGVTKHEISLFPRIIALCDIFDALTSKRSYKDPISAFGALKLMKIQVKEHLDPKLLNKMIMMFK